MLTRSVGAEKTGDGDANMGRYSKRKLDALIDRIKVESDFKKRDVMIRDVLIIQRDDLPLIPLFQTVTAWVMRKNVNGPFGPTMFRTFSSLECTKEPLIKMSRRVNESLASGLKKL